MTFDPVTSRKRRPSTPSSRQNGEKVLRGGRKSA
ncbi:hypothetical protein ACVI3U_003809 [Sinorhizobium medicae]